MDNQNPDNDNQNPDNVFARVRDVVRSDADLDGPDWTDYNRRFDTHFPVLYRLFEFLYGDRDDWLEQLTRLVLLTARSWASRTPGQKLVDEEQEREPTWFLSEKMLGGVCYVDRYAGNLDGVRKRIPYFKELGLTYLHLMPLFLAPEPQSDGGYAVSSYRQVNPNLGTMAELRELATELRSVGINLVVDFIFNHTSNEHIWARKAAEGDPHYSDYYWIFPDRTMPDAFERHVREIFPDDHPGSFVQLEDGRWVWSTFHSYQWDLNYSNPEVFRAMAEEMLFLANQGIGILRMDAVAFIWKELGTPCENLPQAHLLLQAFNAVCRLAAPSLLFKSEAIVHPDQVAEYIAPGECQLSYNPLQMALIWNSMATRDASLLSQALERRHTLPDGTSWVNYVRSHDDIGWTFADEDAAELGINGFEHRRFLNSFYVNRFEGSFAHGVPFQDNPKTGDCRISGTTASLLGMEQEPSAAVERIMLAHSIILSTGGVPLIYLGDEVAQENDYAYAGEAGHDDDSRWVHRPRYPAQSYARRADFMTPQGALYSGLKALLSVRAATPEFAGSRLIDFHTGNRHVLGYQRPGPMTVVLVLANFADYCQSIPAETLSGFNSVGGNLVTGEPTNLDAGIQLAARSFLWLRVTPAS